MVKNKQDKRDFHLKKKVGASVQSSITGVKNVGKYL